MTMIWINLMVVYVFALYARFLAKPSPIGPVFVKPNKFMVFIVVITFITISGLRSSIGDTYMYMHGYTVNDFTWTYVLNNKDMGFSVLQMALKQFTDNPQILILITALVTNLLIVITLYKYTRLFELSVYVYITSGLYITSMNGIRQFLAASIIFAASHFLAKGYWKRYFAVVIFASLFHQSALILIPIYFIVRRKAWTTSTLVLLFLAIFVVLGYNEFSSLLFAAIGESEYGVYKDFSEGGANFIRVIVWAVPVFIAFLGRHKLREIYPNSDFIVNMAMLGVVFMLIATQNWIFARFMYYFGLYNIVLISWIVKLFKTKTQKLIYLAILGSYLVYFYYENVISLGLVYKSFVIPW